MNDELGFQFPGNGLRGQFGVFPGWIMTEFAPPVVANDPIVKIVVRNNVNGRNHRANSTPSTMLIELDLPHIDGRHITRGFCRVEFLQKRAANHEPGALLAIDPIRKMGGILVRSGQTEVEVAVASSQEGERRCPVLPLKRLKNN